MVINNMGHTPTVLLTVAILKTIGKLTPPILAHDLPSKHLAQLMVNFDMLYVQKLQYKPILAVTLHYDTPLTPEIKTSGLHFGWVCIETLSSKRKKQT
ncbi:hypothetical protein AVEN_38504-1 [Araneus ventricosus]|uniref:Uncharacterized protein n=1 Tax=Araneus ventricosus TaxID=182803 RepID=A0A4Y2UMD6_ARAVE|nr:hypothetical protein AVEN_38504-1 [Araneus ventricosus]